VEVINGDQQACNFLLYNIKKSSLISPASRWLCYYHRLTQRQPQ